MKINIEDKLYPPKLRKIKNPPKCIYCNGNIELLEKAGIAIVGSRTCTDYGEKMAVEFSQSLSSYGITIISGMAKGIDSFAHKGTLEIGGNTIAVLPSGLKNVYPKENQDLYNEILENNGLVITEYEDKVEADSKKFLERNRIVSGLSIGILVVEGGKLSGTSVTARIAKEQGKKVFCIPSSLENPKGIIPNRLIKNGAYLVTDVEDIINKYEDLNFKKQKIEKINTKYEYVKNNDIKRKNIEKKNEEIKTIESENIESEYRDIYNILNKEKEIHINEIAKKLNLNINEVSYKLMMLELEDKVISLPGNNYKKRD